MGEVEKRFELVDKRFERLTTILMWGFGLFFTTQIGIILKLFLSFGSDCLICKIFSEKSGDC